MRLFYFVTDDYPAYRVDLTELFAHELKKLGIETTWSMRRGCSGIFRRVTSEGQTVYLPFAMAGIPVLTPILRRIGEIISESFLFFKLLFGPFYDFVQVRDDRYTAAAFALFAARLRGSKFTYWVSFPFPENDLEKARSAAGLYRQFLRVRGTLTKWWLYKLILPRADHIFVQSERMKQDIAAYGLPENRMTPVPMGVPTRLLDWSKTLQFEIERGSVVYLGTLSRSRKLGTVIEAFAQVLQHVPHARLYMVGSGEAPLERLDLEDLCIRLKIVNHVIFTGHLPIEQAWSLAAQAEVCVSAYPSTSILLSGSPTKLYEYLALGRPVVVNDHPEQLATLSATGAGLCVPWGTASFAQAIEYLLTHPDEARKMGEKGPQWVNEHRRYDRLANQVFRQYCSLIQ